MLLRGRRNKLAQVSLDRSRLRRSQLSPRWRLQLHVLRTNKRIHVVLFGLHIILLQDWACCFLCFFVSVHIWIVNTHDRMVAITTSLHGHKANRIGHIPLLEFLYVGRIGEQSYFSLCVALLFHRYIYGKSPCSGRSSLRFPHTRVYWILS